LKRTHNGTSCSSSCLTAHTGLHPVSEPMTHQPACRMALVVAFTITPFGSSERAWKPFNPILGETFELQTGKGVTYLAEQVLTHTRAALPVYGCTC
jgi:hypothetical protein